jgi:hypothetical protein
MRYVYICNLVRFVKKNRIINLHDFRHEGGAPMNSGFRIPVVIEEKEYGPSQQAGVGSASGRDGMVSLDLRPSD